MTFEGSNREEVIVRLTLEEAWEWQRRLCRVGGSTLTLPFEFKDVVALKKAMRETEEAAFRTQEVRLSVPGDVESGWRGENSTGDR